MMIQPTGCYHVLRVEAGGVRGITRNDERGTMKILYNYECG